MSLQDLFSGIDLSSLPAFEPCYGHYSAMDWIIWLDEDVPYRAKHVHDRLDLLLHPDEDRVIGFKIWGATELLAKKP